MGLVSTVGMITVPTIASVLFSQAAQAQSDNGCFMVTSSGSNLNLDGLCGSTATPVTSTRSQIEAGVYRARIKRRHGRIPVIDVMFNGSQTFEMFVDTGASGTMLTREVANALRVVPVGIARVNTASQRGVAIPVGYIKSINVDGAIARDVLVAVAGTELEVGLLGHDFFGDYDVTIKRDYVEFRLRQ